jgi:hypothetical protein
MCYILCMTRCSVCYVVSSAGGFEGGPRLRFFCLEKRVTFFPHFLCRLDFCVHCWAVFRHMVFHRCFSISGQGIRVVDKSNSLDWGFGCRWLLLHDVNEYRICWFSRFGFPWEKSLCNVCIFHCIFSIILLKICLQ